MKFRIIASILLIIILAAAYFLTGGDLNFSSEQTSTEGLPAAKPCNAPAGGNQQYYR